MKNKLFFSLIVFLLMMTCFSNEAFAELIKEEIGNIKSFYHDYSSSIVQHNTDGDKGSCTVCKKMHSSHNSSKWGNCEYCKSIGNGIQSHEVEITSASCGCTDTVKNPKPLMEQIDDYMEEQDYGLDVTYEIKNTVYLTRDHVCNNTAEFNDPNQITDNIICRWTRSDVRFYREVESDDPADTEDPVVPEDPWEEEQVEPEDPPCDHNYPFYDDPYHEHEYEYGEKQYIGTETLESTSYNCLGNSGTGIRLNINHFKEKYNKGDYLDLRLNNHTFIHRDTRTDVYVNTWYQSCMGIKKYCSNCDEYMGIYSCSEYQTGIDRTSNTTDLESYFTIPTTLTSTGIVLEPLFSNPYSSDFSSNTFKITDVDERNVEYINTIYPCGKVTATNVGNTPINTSDETYSQYINNIPCTNGHTDAPTSSEKVNILINPIPDPGSGSDPESKFYTVSVDAKGPGVVSINDTYTNLEVKKGTSVTIIAKPNQNAKLIEWQGITKDESVLTFDITVNTDMVITGVFEKYKYKLEVREEGPGIAYIGTPDIKETTVIKGTSVEVTAVKDTENATFKGWYIGEELISTDEDYSHEVICDTILTAKFGKEEYTVRVISEGPGEVYIDGEKGPVTKVVPDGTVIEDIVPRYDPDEVEFVGWYINGRFIPPISGEPDKFSPFEVNEDVIIIAKFEYKYKYCIVKVEVEGPGDAGIGFEKVKEGKFQKNTEIDLKSNPIEGEGFTSTFVGWYIGNKLISSEPNPQYTVEKDVTLIARFESDTISDDWCVLVVNSNEGGDAYINYVEGELNSMDVKSVMVPKGTEVWLEVNPEVRYRFYEWTSDNGNMPTNVDSLRYKIKVNEDTALTANFKRQVNVIVDEEGPGEAYIDVGGVKVEEITVDEGEFIIAVAEKETGANFNGWYVGEIRRSIDDVINYQVKEDVTLIARFEGNGGGPTPPDPYSHKYTVKVEIGGEGSGTAGIWPNLNTEGRYYYGDNVELRAFSDENSYFVGWLIDGVSVSGKADYSFKMPNKDIVATAIFERSADIIINGGDINEEGGKDSLKILTIRDLRWEDYFVENGKLTNKGFELPQSASGVFVNTGAERDKIKMGYAVEFGFDTVNFDIDSTELRIKVSFLDESGNEISSSAIEDDLTGMIIDEDKYTELVIKGTDNNSGSFMLTAVGADERDPDNYNNGVFNDGISWSWVYYLPPEIYINPRSYNCDEYIIVKFDIALCDTNGREKFNFIKYLEQATDIDWNGRMFKYSMTKSLLDDIYDDAIN